MRRFSLPFLLFCFLLNVVVTRSQVNRHAAIDHLNRGTRELDAGDLDGALAEFNLAIELDPNYSAPYFNRGLVRRRQADYDGAISDFTKAIELNPIAEAYLDRGAARKDKGDREGAIADYTKAIELNDKYADAYYNRGIALDDKGEHDRAISDFTRSIELSPLQAKAFVGRGYARMRKGDPDGALIDYTRAIELNPRSFLAFYNRAFARKKKGDLDGAIADFTKALQIDEKDADAFFERGILRGARGDLDGAISDFGKTIELNPQNAQAHANRGIILLLQDRDAPAQQEFETALKMDSTLNPGLQNLINEIVRGRKSKPWFLSWSRIDRTRDAAGQPRPAGKQRAGGGPDRLWRTSRFEWPCAKLAPFKIQKIAVCSGGIMADEKKCKNPPCTCPQPPDGKYCSASCEGTGDTIELDCDCSHEACQGNF